MSIRLVISDIDGTLVRQDKSLADATVAAFERLREDGIQASLISARGPSGMFSLAQALDITIPLGAFNGGTIFERDGALLAQSRLDRVVTRTVLTLSKMAGVDVWLFGAGEWYARTLTIRALPVNGFLQGWSRLWFPTLQMSRPKLTRSSATGVIILSLIAASIGLPLMMRGLAMPAEPSADAEIDAARIAAAEAAIAEIERTQHRLAEGRKDADVYVNVASRLMDVYRVRIDNQSNAPEQMVLLRQDEAIERELRLAALKAERGEIFRRVRRRELGSDTARKLVRELDLSEARLAI